MNCTGLRALPTPAAPVSQPLTATISAADRAELRAAGYRVAVAGSGPHCLWFEPMHGAEFIVTNWTLPTLHFAPSPYHCLTSADAAWQACWAHYLAG